jgi:hypothetical protein
VGRVINGKNILEYMISMNSLGSLWFWQFNKLRLKSWYTGCPKKNENHWNNVLLKFECPTTKLNAKMRKILTRVHILNIDF